MHKKALRIFDGAISHKNCSFRDRVDSKRDMHNGFSRFLYLALTLIATDSWQIWPGTLFFLRWSPSLAWMVEERNMKRVEVFFALRWDSTVELERDEETHAFCIGCKKWSDPSVHSVSRHVMSKNAQLGSLSTPEASIHSARCNHFSDNRITSLI